MELTTTQALGLRMRSLLLTEPGRPGTVAGIVEWFGAMQAQDMASGLWSLGARLPGSTLGDVNQALERREAIRTWPMRGTVHLVPPADTHWMLDLMGVRALAGAAKRRETIGLSEQVAEKGVETLAAALAGGKRLTRAECLAALADAGLELGPQMGYHLLWYASQKGVTCIAPHVGKEQTFVLLDEWVPKPNRPSREEALGIIARRYFRSHGPATTKDMMRWTGLTARDVKAGVAEAGDALTAVTVDGTAMIAESAQLDAGRVAADAGRANVGAGPVAGWVALPGFDEYLLGYGDRTMMVDKADEQVIIPGGNGIFKSTLVRDGRVAAVWKRTLGKKAVTIDVTPLTPITATGRKHAEAALDPYAAFLGLPARVQWLTS